MQITSYPSSLAPNAAMIRLTKKFGFYTENEYRKKKGSFEDRTNKLRARLVFEEMSHLKKVMQAQGIKVLTIKEDIFFMDNEVCYYPYQAFLTDTGHYFSKGEQLFFIPASYRKTTRRGEEKIPTETAIQLGAIVQPLSTPEKAPTFFEGGDLLQAPDRALFFLGYGQRTERSALELIRPILGYHVIPIELLRKDFFHLDCCFAPLPADALLLYEGEYVRNEKGEVLEDSWGLPLVIKETQTITTETRIQLRKLYDPEKIILLSTAEAFAFGANAVILKSDVDHRFKMFVNGKPGMESRTLGTVEAQLFSYCEETRKRILNLTEGTMDIIEVPYTSLHRAYGSVHCTITDFFQPHE